MDKPIWLFLILVFVTVDHVQGQCAGARCGDCLILDNCAWCKDRNFTMTRCATEAQLRSTNCTSIVLRKQHKIEYIKNSSFSDGGPAQESVQIRPQHVKIKLVPNLLLRTFKVSYKIARNFPLDLYFLNDPSYTMRTLQSSLKALAKSIAIEIKNLTTDFRFGLGTSMDKVILPFTRTSPLYINNPCYGTAITCEPAYSYRHRQDLTADISNFEKAVDAIQTTANFDKPEGLLDGLMQTMVCGNRIGWREKARRMLLYASDINFHQAGDGRLAGILEPNDGLCHLDGTGKYTKAEVQDYPSVGQIIQKAKENNINIIFVIGGNSSALTNEKVRQLFYDKLATLLPGGTEKASELSTDANNILQIVSENYRRLRETVKLVVNEDSKVLSVDMYSDCVTGGRTKDKINICSGLTTENPVDFYPYIQSNFTTCPKERNLTFTIFPEGLEEKVRVDVEHVCDCDCQLEPEAEKNSSKCSFNGTFECGICNCNEGWIGDSCDCDNRGTEEEACGTPDGRICHSVGNCTCRKCECFEGYSGDKCECNDKNCRNYNRLLCGGPDRGRCDCGKCVCNANYTGDACECLTLTTPCEDKNGTICSGNGNCVCGRCVCNNGFRGALCDKCTSCPGICKQNKDCAECFAFGTGLYNSSVCQRECTNVRTAAILEPATPDGVEANETIKACITEDAEKCIINFNVYVGDADQQVVVKDIKRCPPGNPDPITIGLSISGAIFLIGLLLLLIWKLLTMLYDSMEYSRFESEIQNPAWEKSENPIYKECVTTVQNPMHETQFSKDNNSDEKLMT
uniref:Integrin beta n=1 Tax=Crassostrea virginica TaxID=6565 RepID=A0A8B8BT91_CRAVI|nr:integrin beta-3-like [Crassostrea virginica]